MLIFINNIEGLQSELRNAGVRLFLDEFNDTKYKWTKEMNEEILKSVQYPING